ncbi:unnamed protein product [[Candida] boidinii]|nr:unnamed protein product [[Candida] boidinii]
MTVDSEMEDAKLSEISNYRPNSIGSFIPNGSIPSSMNSNKTNKHISISNSSFNNISDTSGLILNTTNINPSSAITSSGAISLDDSDSIHPTKKRLLDSSGCSSPILSNKYSFPKFRRHSTTSSITNGVSCSIW